ncbi:MAG: MoxR family ATPase, partial [Pseudomonadota bacterium]
MARENVLQSGLERIDDLIAHLSAQNYVCGRDLGTVAYLALTLGKPLFLEGEAGV